MISWQKLDDRPETGVAALLSHDAAAHGVARDDTDSFAPAVAAAFQSACLAELEALKPGNVHVFADGHGMQVQDFVRSAEAAASKIALPGISVGERILHAVEATWEAVGCNTNLGIVLLCAPLVHAMLNHSPNSLRERLRIVLDGLSVEDAEHAFKAIVRAAPAGLGGGQQHDVFQPPRGTLLAAMGEAQQRDLIARQYVTAYADVFDFGVPRYRECLQRWERPAWAASAVYLGFLAGFDDTHVARKQGSSAENPKTQQRALLQFDQSLKARGLNPGTCADLTVASLLVVLLEKLCNHVTLIKAVGVNDDADS
jgi:triphosphoribosyl-dephospho-CoA synthase